MLCPANGEPLVIIEVEDVELDVCPEGHGIWFDADELRMLFLKAGVRNELHALDKKLERMKKGGGPKRRCPRCSRKMWHVRSPGKGEHVILDACPDDHGLWFDHGELEEILRSHLVDDEALDRVRDYLGAFISKGDPTDAED